MNTLCSVGSHLLSDWFMLVQHVSLFTFHWQFRSSSSYLSLSLFSHPSCNYRTNVSLWWWPDMALTLHSCE